jgi:hypothetical protein
MQICKNKDVGQKAGILIFTDELPARWNQSVSSGANLGICRPSASIVSKNIFAGLTHNP